MPVACVKRLVSPHSTVKWPPAPFAAARILPPNTTRLSKRLNSRGIVRLGLQT